MANKKLSKLIDNSGLSMNKLSILTGINRSSLYNQINSEDAKIGKMDLKNAINLCLVLKCKLSDIVEDENYKIIKEYENYISKNN